MKIRLIQGDITQFDVDAIVNAANKSLLGGGGVDGAIHLEAGEELMEACILLKGCETAQAKITPGFLLKASHIIHTVGPVYNAMPKKVAHKLLATAYYCCLRVAEKNQITSVAFPNISTGVYGFPKEKAAQIAIKTVKAFQKSKPENLKEVVFCCFDDDNFSIYQKLLKYKN
jgi:O-acetyl-ADP-ribose deacetylase (regulator of RNase III)